MKSKLPSLSTILVALAVAASTYAQTTPIPPTSPNANALLRQAAQTLFEAPALEANISQDVNLFGQSLSGFGKYRQLGEGRGRVWLSLKLVAKGQTIGRLEQICTGETLYIRRETPSRKTQEYISLDQVRRSISGSETPARARAAMHWMAHGGLSRLLLQLAKDFQFSAPQSSHLQANLPDAKLQGTSRYRIPVWILEGEWTAAVLKQMLPEQKDAIDAGRSPDLDELAKHIPHRVEVTLGNDDKFPLFPYKITFMRKADEQPNDQISASYQPIVAMRFFMLRSRPDLGPKDFHYELTGDQNTGQAGRKQNDIEWTDQTAAFIQKLGLKPTRR